MSGGWANIAGGNQATVGGGVANCASGDWSTVAGGMYDSSYATFSFTTGRLSRVPVGYNNSASFNGQAATKSSQLRCDLLGSNGTFFTMDHPLDPDSKMLNLSAVGSPDMLVTFTGDVVLGNDGRCVAMLPDYFDALVKNPRVQLTELAQRMSYSSPRISATTSSWSGTRA